MPPRNSDKNKDVLKEMEKTISPVLVVNNSSLKPYVELFEYSPENIYQQPLGSLVGFFEVKEYSQDSAYIVNFLTSVLKKEYYINPKRPVTESLDSALHKVNMALSELAKHGNVEWLGKLHAAICVLEKNNTHFSVAGNAKIFLYRNKMLSEISEDLASDSTDPHPLKTFVNVSSGRLEKDDRILITSEDIFHILPSTELKKNFQRFEGDKFVQFLKTALSNQMEMIASIIVDMKEPEDAPAPKASPRKKKNKTANVFSEKTFAQSPASIASIEETLQAMQEDEMETEYTDQKTGHIYIQGEAGAPIESSRTQLYWEQTKEKVAEGWYLTKNDIRRRYSLYKKHLAKQRQLRQAEKEKREKIEAEEKQRLHELQVIEEMEREQKLIEEKERQRLELETEMRKAEELKKIAEEESRSREKKLAATAKKDLSERAMENEAESGEPEQEMISKQQQQKILSFQEKLAIAMKEQQRKPVIDLRSPAKSSSVSTEEDFAEDEIEGVETWQEEFSNENHPNPSGTKSVAASFAATISSAKSLLRKISFPNIEASRIIPHFSKIKKLFSSFTSKQKVYVLGALMIIFIVPVFIARFMDKPKPQTISELEVLPPSPAETMSKEKNMNLSASSQMVLSRNDLVSVLTTKSDPVAIAKKSVLILKNGAQNEYPLPEDSGSSIGATFMSDLSLVLILTDQNKILSFSPTSLKFTENKIDLQNNSLPVFIGTYLTYIYVLDPKSDQIYRYPRAEGGFGEKTSWYKDTGSLSQVSDITIDDNIYAIENDKVLKLFKGKKIDFSLESSNTPVHLDKIFTTPEMSSLYALDTKNSRLVSYAKDGKIISQYFNESLKSGSHMTVDETNKTAYITTSSGLLSISLQ